MADPIGTEELLRYFLGFALLCLWVEFLALLGVKFLLRRSYLKSTDPDVLDDMERIGKLQAQEKFEMISDRDIDAITRHDINLLHSYRLNGLSTLDINMRLFLISLAPAILCAVKAYEYYQEGYGWKALLGFAFVLVVDLIGYISLIALIKKVLHEARLRINNRSPSYQDPEEQLRSYIAGIKGLDPEGR